MPMQQTPTPQSEGPRTLTPALAKAPQPAGVLFTDFASI